MACVRYINKRKILNVCQIFMKLWNFPFSAIFSFISVILHYFWPHYAALSKLLLSWKTGKYERLKHIAKAKSEKSHERKGSLVWDD